MTIIVLDASPRVTGKSTGERRPSAARQDDKLSCSKKGWEIPACVPTECLCVLRSIVGKTVPLFVALDHREGVIMHHVKPVTKTSPAMADATIDPKDFVAWQHLVELVDPNFFRKMISPTG